MHHFTLIQRFYLITMAFQVMLYQVSVYGVSDIGLIRRNNEDSWRQLPNEHFYVLADGMGGHRAGEVASYECVERVCSLVHDRFDPYETLEKTKEMLAEVIKEVNASIYRLSHRHSKLRGMGTTLCCLLLHPEGLIYAHVGDSRIYRYRNSVLEQLTHDHSLLRELIDLGRLSEQEADDFLYKNIVTKAIGTELFVEPSIGSGDLEIGDILLMSTDGLTDLLTRCEIEEILTDTSEEEMARNLVAKAKQKGGYDNITVLLIKIQNKYEQNLS